MVKVWFPSMFMRLISVNVKRKPSEAVFHVAPKMTKTEVKEYLTKIYNLDVFNVTTANYAGKWKRIYGKRKTISYRRRNVKRAFVHYSEKEISNGSP